MKSKNLKRWISVCLAAAAITVMAAGCQGKEEAPASGDTNASQSENTQVSDAADTGTAKTDEASDSKDGKTIIGKVSYNMNEAYHQAECAWFEKYAEEAGYETIIIDGKVDSSIMLNSVQDLISKNSTAIMCPPADVAHAEALVQEAQNADVPLATFVNKAETTANPHIRLYEAPATKELGAAAAKKWMEWYPDKKIVMAIIDIPSSQQVHEERALAFVEGVQSVAADAEVAVMLDGESSRDKSMACGEDILQSHPEVNMVYGINANSVLGALAAFEAAGRGQAEDGIPKTELFVGTDGSEQEAIKIYDPNSSLKLTMALSPKNNAKTQIDTAIQLMNGEIDAKSDYEVEVTDVVLDYWSTPIDEFQKFLVDEYFSEMDLKQELGLK